MVADLAENLPRHRNFCLQGGGSAELGITRPKLGRTAGKLGRSRPKLGISCAKLGISVCREGASAELEFLGPREEYQREVLT